jgi:hypothetical protein
MLRNQTSDTDLIHAPEQYIESMMSPVVPGINGATTSRNAKNIDSLITDCCRMSATPGSMLRKKLCEADFRGIVALAPLSERHSC